ncbi:ATP-binding protein [Saccharibacillus sp. CPCC 101409]|uniref:ATP-binding protein n=1 Tax=Saccharibacillus sp. CPCC 101409 TaxID=3058041 RepID=UPI002672310B|nr:ATP-binding protein [Saccharibacillus sp. CPCC 101409]MDO3410211.1 ATP-binding protein [Saccharibacillus sp. CPCC 101409]
MNRLEWISRIAGLHPEDAETQYWLGQELSGAGRYAEALRVYSEGLALCREEKLRTALLQALTSASAALQSGAAAVPPAAAEAPAEPQAEEAAAAAAEARSHERREHEVDHGEDGGKGLALDREPEAASDDESEAESDGEFADRGEAGTSPAAAPGRSAGRPGLQVVDGGRTPARADKPNAIRFEDVAGLEELKKTIRIRIISPFQNQGLFSKFRKKSGGGVLLYGPPGCGKTFIARATAGECGANFMPVSITDILDPYIGVSERNLKDLFDKARQRKPSIMFFDEIDTVGYNRGRSSSSMRGVIDTFLTEMEGIDTDTDQVLILGATNMPWDVDNALKRPGRFDRLVFVAPPDEQAREQMFRLKIEGRYAEGIDYTRLAARTDLFSGADIENLCERAAERAIGEILETGRERAISMEDFEAELESTRPSTLEWLRTAKNYVKYANQSGIYNDVEAFLGKYGRRI